MMERSVEVMKASIQEPRSDGKVGPLVGAALIKKDGNVETASRGELRDGDHAEYTLLERKNRGNNLDGAVLFATLEPCAPGARKHPKLSCAERIVNARVKEVWVGIEDPDPTVDRKGIKFLQENGVKVHIFDRDLQEEIQKVNRKFIEQAEERATAAKEENGEIPIALSDLEKSISGITLADLDHEALNFYRSIARIQEEKFSDDFMNRLQKQGIVTETNGTFFPTGFGLILFGKEPALSLPQARLLGTIHLVDGREETRDFDGPTVFAPAAAIQWLKDKFPNPIDRSGAHRKEIHQTFFELVREGIVNALVHRDYGIAGGKCQLIVRDSKIEIMSPGEPVAPITIDQLKSFDAPMLSRNPVLHYVFAKMQMAEERGLGLKSMRERASVAGIPLPKFSFKSPYVVLSIYRDSSGVLADLKPEVLSELSEAEIVGWTWLVSQDSIATADYEKALNLANRTAKHHLKKMVELGLLKMEGAGRATRYKVVKS